VVVGYVGCIPRGRGGLCRGSVTPMLGSDSLLSPLFFRSSLHQESRPSTWTSRSRTCSFEWGSKEIRLSSTRLLVRCSRVGCGFLLALPLFEREQTSLNRLARCPCSLGGAVLVSESFWSLDRSEGEITINMQKMRKGEMWQAVRSRLDSCRPLEQAAYPCTPCCSL
jgi:hypothetical protein